MLEAVLREEFNGTCDRGLRKGADMARRTKTARAANAPAVRTRPFYLIGHNTNTMEMIRHGLRNRLNAFELDINHDQHGELYVAHDPVHTAQSGREYEPPPKIAPFFKELRELLDSPEGESIALLIFDLKFDQAKLGRQLLEAVRTTLTDQGTTLPVIISTAFLTDAKPLFKGLHETLTPKEGLMIDQEAHASKVAEYFDQHKFPRGCYGDGLTTLPPFGIGLPTPNLPSEFDLAVALKALGQLTFVYPWVLVQSSTMKEFIRIGVDGILVDVGGSASTLAGVVAESKGIRRAVRADDPFWKSPSPVTLEVVTGDKAGAGTDSEVTLIFELQNGTEEERVIDGDRAGRFERGTSTNVTLLDRNVQLDDIIGIAAKQDGEGLASEWFLDRIHLRQLKKEPKSWVFGKWIKQKAVPGRTESTT